MPMPAALCENRTKRDLDRALRRLLEEKPLAQIRVRELTALCGIRRQSFYYHFPDVYALFEWSAEQEAAALTARQELCLTWRQALTDLLLHIGRSRPFYRAVLESRGSAGLEALLREPLDRLLTGTLDYYRRRCGAAEGPGPDRISWGRTLLLSLLERWVQGEISQPPEKLLEPLEALIQDGALGAAWKNSGYHGG